MRLGIYIYHVGLSLKSSCSANVCCSLYILFVSHAVCSLCTLYNKEKLQWQYYSPQFQVYRHRLYSSCAFLYIYVSDRCSYFIFFFYSSHRRYWLSNAFACSEVIAFFCLPTFHAQLWIQRAVVSFPVHILTIRLHTENGVSISITKSSYLGANTVQFSIFFCCAKKNWAIAHNVNMNFDEEWDSEKIPDCHPTLLLYPYIYIFSRWECGA